MFPTLSVPHDAIVRRHMLTKLLAKKESKLPPRIVKAATENAKSATPETKRKPR